MGTVRETLTFGQAVRITEGAAVDLRPNWNADSHSLVFERREGERSGLFRIDTSGSGLEPLEPCNTPGSTVQGRPAFFGQDIFVFASDRGGSFAIWRCNLQAGEVVPLTHGDHTDYGPAALAGEAERFLFLSQDSERDTDSPGSSR